MFQRETSIGFPNIDCAATIWRATHFAVVKCAEGQRILGTLSRHSKGHLDWMPYAEGTSIPAEVFTTVATMI